MGCGRLGWRFRRARVAGVIRASGRGRVDSWLGGIPQRLKPHSFCGIFGTSKTRALPGYVRTSAFWEPGRVFGSLLTVARVRAILLLLRHSFVSALNAKTGTAFPLSPRRNPMSRSLCAVRNILPLLLAVTILVPLASASGPYTVGSSNTVTADPNITRPATTPCVVQLFSDVAFFDFNNENFTYAPPSACPGPWAKVILEATLTSMPAFNTTARQISGWDRPTFISAQRPSPRRISVRRGTSRTISRITVRSSPRRSPAWQ